MPGHGDRLSRKQEQAVAALLSETTLERAADAAGVSRTTLKNWLKRDAFQQAYRRARGQLLEHALTRLQSLSGVAVAVLQKHLLGADAELSYKSAVSVIDRALKGADALDV